MVTKKPEPQDMRKALLYTARGVWRAERPQQTVAEWEASHAEAIQLLAEAQDWNMSRWQQERDAEHEARIARAVEENTKNAPLRRRLTGQLELAQKLLDACTHDATRADCERLIQWLNDEIGRETLLVDLPTKKTRLDDFKRRHLLQLASRVQDAKHMAETMRKAWLAYAADQASIARVQAALATYNTSTES
jgi:hypothetical protein